MTPADHQADALRTIAAAVVRTRARTDRMGRLAAGDGEALLCDVEHALASLIVTGAVPRPHDAIDAPHGRIEPR